MDNQEQIELIWMERKKTQTGVDVQGKKKNREIRKKELKIHRKAIQKEQSRRGWTEGGTDRQALETQVERAAV